MNATWTGFLVVSFLVVFAGTAMAQSAALKVDVPFAFVVNRDTLPAGSYTVTEVRPDLLFIEGSSASCYVTVIPNDSAKLGNAAELSFVQYGDARVLSQISGDDRGWNVPVSRSESTLANDMTPAQTAAAGQ